MRFFAALVGAFVVVLYAASASSACGPDSILAGRAAHRWRGVDHAERLTDGVLTSAGGPSTSELVSEMKGLHPYVEWDLGEPTRLTSFVVQADHDDTYGVSGSEDGKHYRLLWRIDPVQGEGLRERTVADLDVSVRFLRFEAISGDQLYAASEVRAYCAAVSPERDARDDRAQSLALLAGLASFPLLFYVATRLDERRRRLLYGALFGLSAACWVRFGVFSSKSEGDVLKPWDVFHYHLGAKYFPETGYTDLYRCIARAERESGRGNAVDAAVVRDLRNNRLLPGTWTNTEDGQCRASFSPARWASFRADLDAWRKIVPGGNVTVALSDHGFNATPLQVAFLRLVAGHVAPSRGTFVWLAQLDSVALAGTVAAATWGFGPVPGVVTALVLGVGAPWSYSWVGGSLGRHEFLLCAVLGLALFARGRPFGGAALLTVSALLRLFPVVFVGAAALWALRAPRERRRIFAGIAVAAAVGVAVAGASVGFASFPRFVETAERHAHSVLANQIGLDTLLAYSPGEDAEALADPRQTNPYEPWETAQLERRQERRPWALAALVVSVAVLFVSTSAVECVALSGLVLFCALAMTAYDYSWLVVLVGLAKNRPLVLPLVLGFAVFTVGVALFGPEQVEVAHVVLSAACGLLLVAAVPWRELRARIGR